MNPDLIDLLVVALAGARLSRLIVTDKISSRFRATVKLWFPPGPPYSKMVRLKTRKWAYLPTANRKLYTFLPGLISCNWCASIWTTGATAAAWFNVPATRPVVTFLAAAMLAGLANDYFTDDKDS